MSTSPAPPNADAGRDPAGFVATTLVSPTAVDDRRLREIGVDRVTVMARPPYIDSIRQLAATGR